MKKLLGILAVAALTTSVFAQGTVSALNLTGLVKKWTATDSSVIVNQPRSGGYVQLFVAPAAQTLANSLFSGNAALGDKLFANYSSLNAFLLANPNFSQPVNTTSGNPPILVGAGSGIFNGGTYTIPSTVLPNAGTIASYFMVGWTGSWLTMDAALADAILPGSQTMMGISSVFQTSTGNPLTTPPGTAVQLKGSFTGMTLAPVYVPEPGTFALAGLGLAALLVFRRRK